MQRGEESRLKDSIDEMIGDLRLYINDNLNPGVARRHALEGLNECQTWCAIRLEGMMKDRISYEDIPSTTATI